MNNLAHQVVVPITKLTVVESKVADLNDGYVRLATVLLESIAGSDLTKRQLKVILAVIRLTYGWNKAVDRIANSQISEIARLPVKRVSETRVQLLKMNVLIQRGQQIGPNKNISEWSLEAFAKSPEMGDENPSNKGIPQSEGESPKSGGKESPEMRESNPPKQGDTIDTIPKTNTDNETPHGEVASPCFLPGFKFAMQKGWSPGRDFKRQAALWGISLPEKPYSDEELNSFVDYWLAEGKSFHQTQWEQKFARSIQSQIRRAPQQKNSWAKPENFAGKDYGTTEIPEWARD